MFFDIAPLDILFGIIILFFIVRVGMKGFLAELMTFAAPLLALISAVLFSGFGAQLLTEYIGETAWNQIIAFLSIFILTYIIVKIIEKSLDNFLDEVNLEKFDRALGVFLGFIEGVMIVIIIIMLLNVQTFFKTEEIFKGSFIVDFLKPFIPYLQQSISQAIGNVQ